MLFPVGSSKALQKVCYMAFSLGNPLANVSKDYPVLSVNCPRGLPIPSGKLSEGIGNPLTNTRYL
jgi:hypothetical protein